MTGSENVIVSMETKPLTAKEDLLMCPYLLFHCLPPLKPFKRYLNGELIIHITYRPVEELHHSDRASASCN